VFEEAVPMSGPAGKPLEKVMTHRKEFKGKSLLKVKTYSKPEQPGDSPKIKAEETEEKAKNLIKKVTKEERQDKPPIILSKAFSSDTP
jgi:hypothetical protein